MGLKVKLTDNYPVHLNHRGYIKGQRLRCFIEDNILGEVNVNQERGSGGK